MTTPLTDAHLHMLTVESGIAPEVIAERGYRSVDGGKDYATLKALGFPRPRGGYRDGLLLPLHTTDGKHPLTIYRPDVPPIGRDGRAKKYLIPTGHGARVDCPPRCQPFLKDPTRPVYVTEGQRKGDSLASRGALVVCLLGVWNFNGKNPFGGVTFLADWDHIACNDGRELRIVFDSDVFHNLQVRCSMERLQEHLTRKGATVRIVYLPPVAGKKVGVDDYLVAGHTLQDLEALIEAPRLQPQPAPAHVELLDESPLTLRRPLALIDGRTYAALWPWTKETLTEVTTKAGEIVRLPVPKIITEQRLVILRDDGVVFGERMEKPMADLGLEVKLPEIPATPKLWQTPSMKAYRAGQRPEPKAVFAAVKTVVNRFIDFNRSLASQGTMCELVACYIMATWFLDAFPVIGYLWPNGGKGSGKTQLLTIIAELAYLGQMLQASGTMATLRDLSDYGATLCFDDAETIMDLKKGDPEKRTLLLAGNRKGNCITVKEDVSGKWQTRYVETFCPRLFSAIRLPDPVLASRTIIVPLIRTADADKANADPLDYRLWPIPRAHLVNDLWALALSRMAELPTSDAHVADTATLLGRNLEPWRAILAVAHWLTTCGVDGLYQRMTDLAHAYQHERRELEPPDLTAWTIQGVGKACIKCTESLDADGALFVDASSASNASSASSASERLTWILTTHEITEAVQELLKEAEGDLKPEQVTSQRIGKVLHALRLKKLPQKKRGEARKWEVTRDDLFTHYVTYGLDLPEEIFPKNPDASQLDALDAAPSYIPKSPYTKTQESGDAGGLNTLDALDALDALDDLMQRTPCPHLCIDTQARCRDCGQFPYQKAVTG